MSLVKQYAALRDKRIAAQREVDTMYEAEQLLKEQLIGKMLTEHHGAMAEGKYVLTLTQKTVPVVFDWPVVIEYIRRTGQLDLLHRRLTESAITARWAEGETIPGVVPQPKYDLKLKENI
jgi:hypothetical protein